MVRAARLAIGEINADGGVRGRPLQLVERDDQGQIDSAVAIAAQLVDTGVVAVIGHAFSRTTLAAAPVYQSANHPVAAITPSSSAPEVSEAGEWIFRICPTDLVHGAELARWAFDGLGLHRGIVFYLNDAYGRGVRKAFVDRFESLGGEVLGAYPYLGGSPDMKPFLDREAQSGQAQFLLIAGNRSEAETVLTQARARGITIPILGGDGLEGIEEAGALANGAFVSAAYLPTLDTPANRRFVQAYANRYPGSPRPNQPAAATYDAVYLLQRAITSAGTDRRAIRDALAGIGERDPFRGVTGIIAFDEHGDVVGSRVWISMVRDGAITLAGQAADRSP